MRAETFLPQDNQLDQLLELETGSSNALQDLLDVALLDPLRGFLNRPGKKIRAELVELGFRAAQNIAGAQALTPTQARLCARASEVLEGIHAGSLVVDDIQDSSTERRGLPTLHLSHGVPLALNAGNWLYFWPFEKIRAWGLEAGSELRIYRLCHQALLRAHFGQAIDIGTPIDTLPQSRVASVCLASLELKTGALSSLATSLGGALGNSDEVCDRGLRNFGLRFGVALQMFDDIGNTRERAGAKRFEDVRLRRPSWIWAVAAETFSPAEFLEFNRAVEKLPLIGPLIERIASTGLDARAKFQANHYLEKALEGLGGDFGKGAGEPGEILHALVRPLAERLSHAYD